MKRPQFPLTRILVVILAGIVQFASSADDKKENSSVFQFKMKTLAGKDVEISKYRGQVLLVVNVASQCGYTPQYRDLQALHEKYGKSGLKVMGFPCNQFGQQEPGSAEEIADFCSKNYGVTFDLFEKVNVNGSEQCGLYKYLTSRDTNAKFAGPINWNFEKFLIGRDGTVVARFASDVDPLSPKLVKAIEGELAKK